MLSEAWGGGKVPIQILDGMLCWGPEQQAWGGQGPYPNFGWNVVLGAGARCCLKLGGGGGRSLSKFWMECCAGAGARCCLKLGGGGGGGGARSLSKFWMECCAGGRSKVLSEAWGGQGPYPNFGWNVVLGAGARCCLKLGGGGGGGKVPIQIFDGMLFWGPEQGAA